MGYSPWGCKESGMIERLSTAQHSLSYSTRDLQSLLQHAGSSVFVTACGIFSCSMQTLGWACGF